MERAGGGWLHLKQTGRMRPSASLVQSRFPQSEAIHQFHRPVSAQLFVQQRDTSLSPLPAVWAPGSVALRSEEGPWRRKDLEEGAACPVFPKGTDAKLHLLWFHWQPFNLCRDVKDLWLREGSPLALMYRWVSMHMLIYACIYILGSFTANLPCCCKKTRACSLALASANDSNDLSFFPQSLWRCGFV